ncbi:hypothetical protein KZC51_09950 [Microbacterium sp. SSW1-49]|uniref:Integral membrane protein n=1 Tax=Microbacterium croceum TaxID=2851645 RepID=A0ABT0FEH1_9MICO|nr:hypothetical protein [Microbacterium croceum]MCK2036459.1 hypothetical protein [Microbacterium croceum]
MTSRQLRLMRAVVVSAAATLIAAVSHTIGGGAAPHPLLILAVSALITPLSALVIGVRRSRVRTTATVLFAQAAFHVVFQMLGAPTVDGAIAPPGHAHHLELSQLGAVSALPAPSLAMLGAHVVAAVLTLFLLWHAESLLQSIVDWVQTLLRPVPSPTPPEHRRPPLLVSTLVALTAAALTAGVSRRGPPALLRG